MAPGAAGDARGSRDENREQRKDLTKVPEFEHLLEDDAWRAVFIDHMVNEHSPEGMAFFTHVRQFKKVTKMGGLITTRELAKYIYNTFITEHGVMQINVASDVTEAIKARLELTPVPADIFDAAMEEQLSTMKQDNYSRFKRRSGIARMLL